MLKCLTFMKAEAGREGSCGHSAAWVRGLGFPQTKGEILRRFQGKFLIGLLGFPQAKGDLTKDSVQVFNQASWLSSSERRNLTKDSRSIAGVCM
jgi:hypothetical protein